MKDGGSTDALLFTEERSQAAAELGAALRRLPVAARRAANPIDWFRRHPIAAGAVTALGALALYGQIRTSRGKPIGRAHSWLHTLSLQLLRTVRRSLIATVTARLAGRGGGTPPYSNGQNQTRTQHVDPLT